jgi:hypothetical protein
MASIPWLLLPGNRTPFYALPCRVRDTRHPKGMKRYYFHLADGERTFKDEAGMIFATPADAEGHAATMATKLASEHRWNGFSVVVEDERGEIARVPIHRH